MKVQQLLMSTLVYAGAVAAEWEPVKNSMLTVWGKKVDASNVWNEYPRPQLERENWVNLNGMWQYEVVGIDHVQPVFGEKEILVPFALEAPLSGVGRKLGVDEALWYRRVFDYRENKNSRLLLHFEAVDYKSEIWVNGTRVGMHVGGNLPFSFDISSHVKPGENEIVLKVVDATNQRGKYQLRGKQVLQNGGITYTRVSGIWQTVWLENVPENYIESLKIDTELSGNIFIKPSIIGKGSIRTSASLNGKKVAEGGEILNIQNPQFWSPESPVLYDLKIELLSSNGEVMDCVKSYAGIREVGKRIDENGNWRLTLNGNDIFHWGPLDQGWWPDGLLTPPSEEAMLFDMKYLKEAGFNMIRKHIKVEPRRFYYQCDKMGFLVWQDHVSGGQRAGAPKDATEDEKKAALARSEWPEWIRLHDKPSDVEPEKVWPDWAHKQWMIELKGMVDHLYNHPSIVVWVPFNERWGQHCTMEVGRWISQYDPTRTINIASGGNFFPIGDIADEHAYPHPRFPLDDSRYKNYVKVIGEFGGHGWPVKGHLWKEQKKNLGYGGLPKTIEEFKERYRKSIELLSDLKRKGISAGVYTQTTDVEIEINGLLTYDRKVLKIPAEELRKLNAILNE
ncbi:glycoside hydrolase family 2 protein [Pontiella agarivorans]|uniref:Glycoside hydrolase family 2 TIM barrel-domain containing protein n=1 Tax=Pontiella agarivorans TaxID=3038953 RepID=A0ABU5MTS5_9BACT|nr:sugar-binding domain-containing protein [Pontiella agarivorans]MDZ8117573.1 glycoside hydrolase family 2 TIM barrel-domain containing protein [Pontiella agarivorans]